VGLIFLEVMLDDSNETQSGAVLERYCGASGYRTHLSMCYEHRCVAVIHVIIVP
jgi:hypothetical protein